jgi:hypothetical protein
VYKEIITYIMENAENDGTVKCSLLKKYVDMRDMWLFEYGNTIWGWVFWRMAIDPSKNECEVQYGDL